MKVSSPKVYDAKSWVDIELKPDRLQHSTYMFKREIDHFIKCISRDRDPVITGADGRACTEVVLAAYRSHERCEKVRLPLTS